MLCACSLARSRKETMALYLQLTIALTLLYTCSDAAMPGMPDHLVRNGFLGVLSDRRSYLEKGEPSRDTPSGEVRWFDQKLDHFNPEDSRRWKQKYVTDFAEKARYLFVYISGEGYGTILAGGIDYLAMSYYASKHNASCAVLEHRYYGESRPVPDMSVKNLRYLSSRQALADAAAFITARKEELSAEKVIVFGGSYPGKLAAWFRLKYPHLAQGAVASSAPVLSKADFSEAKVFDSKPLDEYKTGNVCTIAIAEAVAKIQELTKTEAGRARIKKLFNFCDDTDPSSKSKDMAFFNIDMSFQIEFRPVTKRCDRMTNTSLGEPIERYATLVNRSPRCNSYNYEKLTIDTRNETFSFSDERQYEYQLCTEFGHFFTSGSDKQPFRGFPVEFYLEKCADLYGPEFTPESILRSMRDTNIYYGGKDYAENNVVFVNGGQDVFSLLSITHSLPNAPAIFMPDAGHCADLQPPSPDDPPYVVKAHEEILKLIGQWLA